MKVAYKAKYLRQREINMNLFRGLFSVIVILISIIIYLTHEQSPLICPVVDCTTAINVATVPARVARRWEGVASWYSIEGCIGCNEDRIMANGVKLDDTIPTIAFHHLPLNSWVVVTNLDNNMFIKAQVTDTGGFEERYGRIADINIKVKKAINCGGLCNVEIKEVK